MEDYVRGTNELIELSKAESTAALRHPERAQRRTRRWTAQNQANALRSDSATLVGPRARPRRPDELSEAQRLLRRGPGAPPRRLAEVADQLPGALAKEERRNSTARIAEMMQVFQASDVLLTARFEPS